MGGGGGGRLLGAATVEHSRTFEIPANSELPAPSCFKLILDSCLDRPPAATSDLGGFFGKFQCNYHAKTPRLHRENHAKPPPFQGHSLRLPLERHRFRILIQIYLSNSNLFRQIELLFERLLLNLPPIRHQFKSFVQCKYCLFVECSLGAEGGFDGGAIGLDVFLEFQEGIGGCKHRNLWGFW